MPDDQFPVQWMGQRAIVAFPGQVDVSNVDQLRDRLLSVINRGAAVVVVDMTGTLSCDHAVMDAIARAYQRAAASGAQLRLVVTAPVIRRVLGIEGLDRVVSIYPSLEAAEAAGPLVPPPLSLDEPPGSLVGIPAAEGITPAMLWQVIDALGDGLILTGQDGTIALVNRRCAEMFGYQREELIGLPVDALVPPDVQAAHRGYRAGYGRDPRSRPMGDRARLAGLRKDGATFPAEISLSPVPTATATFVMAVVRDATQARRRDDLADLARGAAVGRSPLAKDLLDRIVHRLFQVGLGLQDAASLPAEVAQERLRAALDELDETIHEIRDYAFGGEGPRPAS
jgi:anti-anti-sigma factor